MKRGSRGVACLLAVSAVLAVTVAPAPWAGSLTAAATQDSPARASAVDQLQIIAGVESPRSKGCRMDLVAARFNSKGEQVGSTVLAKARGEVVFIPLDFEYFSTRKPRLHVLFETFSCATAVRTLYSWNLTARGSRPIKLGTYRPDSTGFLSDAVYAPGTSMDVLALVRRDSYVANLERIPGRGGRPTVIWQDSLAPDGLPEGIAATRLIEDADSSVRVAGSVNGSYPLRWAAVRISLLSSLRPHVSNSGPGALRSAASGNLIGAADDYGSLFLMRDGRSWACSSDSTEDVSINPFCLEFRVDFQDYGLTSVEWGEAPVHGFDGADLLLWHDDMGGVLENYVQSIDVDSNGRVVLGASLLLTGEVGEQGSHPIVVTNNRRALDRLGIVPVVL